jgi:hypothetical protein
VHLVAGRDRCDLTIKFGDDRPPALLTVHVTRPSQQRTALALGEGSPRSSSLIVRWSRIGRTIFGGHQWRHWGGFMSYRPDIMCIMTPKGFGARAGAAERDAGAPPGGGTAAA